MFEDSLNGDYGSLPDDTLVYQSSSNKNCSNFIKYFNKIYLRKNS